MLRYIAKSSEGDLPDCHPPTVPGLPNLGQSSRQSKPLDCHRVVNGKASKLLIELLVQTINTMYNFDFSSKKKVTTFAAKVYALSTCKTFFLIWQGFKRHCQPIGCERKCSITYIQTRTRTATNRSHNKKREHTS